MTLASTLRQIRFHANSRMHCQIHSNPDDDSNDRIDGELRHTQTQSRGVQKNWRFGLAFRSSENRVLLSSNL
jgi:hypothetical protein